MDGKKINEQIEKNEKTPNKLPTPFSPIEQKDFLDKLNLKVPEEEKKLYEQIILANQDVFSKTKDKLGKANNFKHKIFTKNDEPVFRNNIQFWK